MKIDPYNHKERYLKWKEEAKEGISNIGRYNSEVLKRYLLDMERGMNVSIHNVKGSRSYIRLATLRDKMIFIIKNIEKIFGIDKIVDISEEQICTFFSDMRTGIIKKSDGTAYLSVADYVKIFKAFWHWWATINRKQDREIRDITLDLDTRSEKPKWVYLTEEEVRKLWNRAKGEYRILMMFLFDAGIRAPTELMNVRVYDLINDCKELNIRQETSKTFGRKIKLMICSSMLKEYIETEKLSSQDLLFDITPSVVNRYLKKLAGELFGDKKTLAGGKYSELTMYDFRHISCCYWLPRYKSESALKYRFGWKSSDFIHYYSEMLGMKDTINEEDLLVDITKTEIERRLIQSEKEREILQEKQKVMEENMEKIKNLTDELYKKVIKIENMRIQ